LDELAHGLDSFRSSELLMAYLLGYDLTAKTLIVLSREISRINRTYIDSLESLFESTLAKRLHAKYGGTYFPFASRYQLADVPKRHEIVFANFSLPSEIRTGEIPSLLEYQPFIEEVKSVLAETHEMVKCELKGRRKKR
jgi:hypothetical protein